MRKISEGEFKSFFRPYSKNVGSAEKLYFWKLSDSIIEAVIKRHIPKNASKKSTILDAGGGTGRWIIKLSNIYKSRFILYDLSEDMLTVAEQNMERAGLKNRVKIILGDITNMLSVKSDSVDYIISIYNPISFVSREGKAISEMFRVLKKNGILFIMGQGYYNAIYSKINNYFAPPKELGELKNKEAVRWNAHVPLLKVFSKESLEGLLKDAGFHDIISYGIPVFVQPGPEDFDPKNKQKSRISEKLEKYPEFFKKVFETEMEFNSRPEVINRGMNIISVAKK